MTGAAIPYGLPGWSSNRAMWSGDGFTYGYEGVEREAWYGWRIGGQAVTLTRHGAARVKSAANGDEIGGSDNGLNAATLPIGVGAVWVALVGV